MNYPDNVWDALEMADNISVNVGTSQLCIPYDEHYSDRLHAAFSAVICYVSEGKSDGNILRAVTILGAALFYIGQKEQARLEARDKTRTLRKSFDYPQTLLKIGRRDGFACRVCGYSGPDLEIDHIFPVCKGGTNDLDNLQILCQHCNRVKSDRVV